MTMMTKRNETNVLNVVFFVRMSYMR